MRNEGDNFRRPEQWHGDFKQHHNDGDFHHNHRHCDKHNNEAFMSAYDLAVKNGYRGTEREWLESLKGTSAYESAVKGGYQGTEADFYYNLSVMSNYQYRQWVGTKEQYNTLPTTEQLREDTIHYILDEVTQGA